MTKNTAPAQVARLERKITRLRRIFFHRLYNIATDTTGAILMDHPSHKAFHNASSALTHAEIAYVGLTGRNFPA